MSHLSLSQTQLKAFHKYHQRKFREHDQVILVEGRHPVHAAVAAGLPCTALFLLASHTPNAFHLPASTPVYEVSTDQMAGLTTTDSPPSIMGIFNKPAKTTLPALASQTPPLWLILDRLQDPGNVGTLLRSAAAFGFTAVITTSSTVDLYNPKVIRASAGVVFSQPTCESDLSLAAVMATTPTTVSFYVTTAHADQSPLPYTNVTFTPPLALVLGNEGQGIDWQQLPSQTYQPVYIPMAPSVESLNVSVCGSIMMAEVARQLNLVTPCPL